MFTKTDELIDWPEQLRGDPYKVSFLTGFPFFGPHVKILKNAKSILRRRTKRDVEYLWSDYSFEIPSQDIVECVYIVSDEYLKWPNHLFVPLDRAAIVFGFIPGIDIELEDVIEDICKKIGVLPDSDASFQLFESMDGDNLLDFFKCIKEIIEKK